MATVTLGNTGRTRTVALGHNKIKAENQIDFSVTGQQANATDVIEALLIPKGAFVTNVGYYVKTVTTGTGDIDGIGDGSSTSGWIATDGDLASAGLNRNSLPGDVYPALGGKLYTANDTIDILMKTGVNTDGVVVVWAEYSIIEAVALA